eukprot:3886287-Pleurochrysis_carterae.AAC.7
MHTGPAAAALDEARQVPLSSHVGARDWLCRRRCGRDELKSRLQLWHDGLSLPHLPSIAQHLGKLSHLSLLRPLHESAVGERGHLEEGKRGSAAQRPRDSIGESA